MSRPTHYLSLKTEHGYTTWTFVCEAPPEADCHLSCDGGCEEWSIVRTPDGPVDRAGHPLVQRTRCLAAEWIEDGEGVEDCHDDNVVGGDDLLVRLPVHVRWEPDIPGYVWRVSP